MRKPNSFLKEATDIWHNWYLQEFGFKYSWTAKDFTNLKILLRRLNSFEGDSLDNLRLILSTLKQASPWHYNNASVPLIQSHLNQLIAKQTKHESNKDFFAAYFKAGNQAN